MITIDTTTNGLVDGAATLTFAIAPAVNVNKLIVQVACWGTNRAISGVTFNGVAMTKAVQNDDAGDGNNASIWYMDNPPSGSHNVVVTAPGAAAFIRAAAVSLFGAKAGAANVTGGATYTGAVNGRSVSVTTTAPGCWLFDAILDQSNNMTVTSPQVNNFNAGDLTSQGSYKANVPAGSNAMAWTWTGTESGVNAIAAFAPAPSSGFFAAVR